MIDLAPVRPRGTRPVWLAVPTRAAGLSRSRALSVVFALVALIVIAIGTSGIDMTGSGGDSGSAGMTDLLLYQSIIEGVRAGDAYHIVAVDALRAGGYPLRPFVAVRLPTLAVVLAALSPLVAALLQWALALAVITVWYGRIARAVPRFPGRITGLILLAGGMTAFVDVDLAAFHEIWAAMLIALALGVRTPDRWVEAAAFGLMAMLLRETAALFVLVMLALAVLQGHRREAIGWASALAAFAIVVGFHAAAVGALTGPLDPLSPGWAGLHGPGLFLRAVSMSTALTLLPAGLAAMLVVLAVLGWAGWRDPAGLRVAVTVLAYAVLIALFGRIDIFYWGLMVAPILLVGLVFLPDTLRDLWLATLDRRRVRVVRVGS